MIIYHFESMKINQSMVVQHYGKMGENKSFIKDIVVETRSESWINSIISHQKEILFVSTLIQISGE